MKRRRAEGTVSARCAVFRGERRQGTTDITSAVPGGSYETWSLAPGATYLITAIVNVSPSAPKGSNINRLVTISSVGDGTKQDTVKYVAKRAK